MQGYQGEDGAVQRLAGAIYRTGDVAMRDGDFTCVGRADDIFKASDYRISPFELERALIEHPAVAGSAIVPSPDALRLAVQKAFVALAAGHVADRATALSIFRYLREHLAPFRRGRRLQFPELPKRSPARSAASNCAPGRPGGAPQTAAAIRPNSGGKIFRSFVSQRCRDDPAEGSLAQRVRLCWSAAPSESFQHNAR